MIGTFCPYGSKEKMYDVEDLWFCSMPITGDRRQNHFLWRAEAQGNFSTYPPPRSQTNCHTERRETIKQHRKYSTGRIVSRTPSMLIRWYFVLLPDPTHTDLEVSAPGWYLDTVILVLTVRNRAGLYIRSILLTFESSPFHSFILPCYDSF